jgi:hypothetical protein
MRMVSAVSSKVLKIVFIFFAKPISSDGLGGREPDVITVRPSTGVWFKHSRYISLWRIMCSYPACLATQNTWSVRAAVGDHNLR